MIWARGKRAWNEIQTDSTALTPRRGAMRARYALSAALALVKNRERAPRKQKERCTHGRTGRGAFLG